MNERSKKILAKLKFIPWNGLHVPTGLNLNDVNFGAVMESDRLRPIIEQLLEVNDWLAEAAKAFTPGAENSPNKIRLRDALSSNDELMAKLAGDV